MPRIYISGPMTGMPEHNYPAFASAAAEWRAIGWDVDNPGDHFGGDQTRTYKEYIEVDIQSLMDCDAIAMLPGWDSATARGSIWEHAIAVQMLGLPVYDALKPVVPWSPDNDPRGGEVVLPYAEVQAWREYRRRQLAATQGVNGTMPSSVQGFVDAAIPLGAAHG